MTEILLFHHALGLTDGVRWLAERLAAAGHTVHTPDLFAGRTFSTIEDGVAHAEQDVGVDGLLQRADEAAAGHPGATGFLGISLGALPSYWLAQTRPSARACIAISAALPVDHFAARWPDGVALDLHLKSSDPWGEDDLPVAWRLAGEVAELYEYPGDQHLFTEHGHPHFDPAATELVLARTLATLSRV
ncbi:dienelactone hydrolase family protein [Citricoccus sp.]|uniref:dienelactone hydrolase family protein n=1 Tax=Citricoccus sp. TaxID=1978372 RepID=UPI0028BEB357|nr:dienelactone hydrolase family protein [Citricoccus sp.]